MIGQELSKIVGLAVVGTLAIVLLATIAVRDVWLPGALLACLLAALGWRVTALIRRRTPAPVHPEVGHVEVWPYTRAFGRVDHISELLDFARTGTRHFEYGVRPILVDLVDDRVRRHHGVDRRRDPEQARAIMGEDLWSLVTTEQQESPGPDRLRKWVTAIERL